MNDLATTQMKLRTTPTGGVDSEHSPYYRRLLSAGYKGFLQGTIGGATFYGFMGAIVGTLIAAPLMLGIAGPAIAAAAWALIPGAAAVGVAKGAMTFGNIGSMAAISAESAEMSEKRRYLLDRYYDLPNTPEFDGEAAKIQELLAKQHEPKKPPQMFHMKTVLVGAVLGALICAGFVLLGAGAAPLVPGLHLFAEPLVHVFQGLAPLAAGALGAAIGGLGGATIGLDRWYVRKWLDVSQTVVQDGHSVREKIAEREMEIQSLGRSSPVGYSTPQHPVGKIHFAEPPQRREAPVHPESGVQHQHPGTRVQHANVEDRVQHALRTPVV